MSKEEYQFEYVNDKEIQESDGLTDKGFISTSRVKILDVGAGDAMIKMNPQYGFSIGASNFDDAPFKVDMLGNLIAEDGTITGGTIQTATSGKRVRIVSEAASDPTQAANSLALISGDDSTVINLGTESSVLMSVRPDEDVIGLIVQASDGLDYTKTLFSASVLDSDSTGGSGVFENSGTGTALSVQPNSTGIGLHIQTSGATVSSTDVVRIDSNKNGDSLKINKSTNAGRGVYISMTGTSNNYQPLYITNAGTGGSLISQTNSAGNNALEIQQSRAGYAPLLLTQNTVTSTNFKAVLQLGTIKIWTSNGTSPNGSLSSFAGDICFGGDSGKAYYCTGTTNWTAL